MENIKLDDIFKEIRINTKYYSSARNGEQFENKFKNKLKAYGFSEIVQRTKSRSAIEEISDIEKMSKKKTEEIYDRIKEKILLKNSIQIEKNIFQKIKNAFIFQPYGSQNFPDFLIFTNKHILPIEIKFTKNEKGEANLNSARPMWNSNMPKPNAIYIYGVANEVVTFFRGSKILDFNTREALLDFFQTIEKRENILDNKLKDLKNNFGIYPYVRKAYAHSTTKSTYIDLNNKKVIESYFSENAKVREKDTLNFLRELNEIE